MRQTIETAPRDGSAIILEDDATVTYDVAHWSPEAGEWVGENGEPIKITPSHWYSMPRDKYLTLESDGSSNPSEVGPSPARARRYATSSVAAALVTAALIGTYFRAEVAAFVTRYAGQQDIFGGSTIGEQAVVQGTQLQSQGSQKPDLLALQQEAEADQASAQAAAQEAAQVKRAVEASVPEAQQSLEREQRAEALATELAEARRTIDRLNLQLRVGAANSAQSLEQEREKTTALAQDAADARQELTASTAQDRRALEEERARGAALASELAKARREVEANVALLNKARDDAAQFKQTAERMTAELQQEHDRAEASSRELEIARREVEANVALLNKARDDAAQFKQTAERMTAELQQERDRAEASSRELAMARKSAQRAIDTRTTLQRTANSQIAQVTQAVEASDSKQPAAEVSKGDAEAAKLIVRARALLGQGNIAAARIVLERATEMGSAQASFTLAETYDPVILSAWGTYGTRGDATKARELYAKAHAGGIQEAKDRLNALR